MGSLFKFGGHPNCTESYVIFACIHFAQCLEKKDPEVICSFTKTKKQLLRVAFFVCLLY
jgi:hypothetical protein